MKLMQLFLIDQIPLKTIGESIGQIKGEAITPESSLLRKEGVFLLDCYQAKRQQDVGDGHVGLSNKNTPYDTSDNNEKGLIYEYKEIILRYGSSGKCMISSFFGHLTTVRSAVQQQLSSFFPSNHSALFIGLLLGGKQDFDPLFQQKFKNVGALHIISASGYNISLMLTFFAPLLGKIKKNVFSITCTFLLIITFLVISGFSPSLLRAAFMAIIALLSKRLFHRQYHPLYVLFFTAGIFLFFFPALVQELSFQLSFAATLGVLLFGASSPRVGVTSSKFSITKIIWSLVTENFYITLAAQSFTLPLIWYSFGEVNLVGFISNIFLLLLAPILTVGTLLHLILQWIPFLSYISGGILWLGGNLFFFLVDAFNYFSTFARFSLSKLSFWALLIWWGALFSVYLFRQRREEGGVY
jgi:ComEC/Rec2-related protein